MMLLTTTILALFLFWGCTQKKNEATSPEKLLEEFIMEKYGVSPSNKLGDSIMYVFGEGVNLSELELEMIFPVIPGGHTEPCIILFDKKNMRFTINVIPVQIFLREYFWKTL